MYAASIWLVGQLPTALGLAADPSHFNALAAILAHNVPNVKYPMYRG